CQNSSLYWGLAGKWPPFARQWQSWWPVAFGSLRAGIHPPTGAVSLNNPENPVWTADDAAELYAVREWGAGLFDVADNGDLQVTVTNNGKGRHQVSLLDIVDGLQQRDLAMPVLLRIENHLDTAITQINEAFASAIKGANY